IDSTEVLGDFEPDEIKTFTGAFQFDVSNQVPDDHEIIFNTLILDVSGDDWSSHIYLTAYAPDIYAGGVVIDDGGNGGLDPGETTDIIVTLYNSGGASANNLIATLSSEDPYITINSNTANLENIAGNSTSEVVFNITASDETPSGYIIEFELDIQADNEYYTTTMTYIVVGLITEGFESGNFSAFPWNFSGNAEWVIDNSVYYEGSFSARSGDIGDNQSSSMMLEICVLGDGEISFAKKVSSEGGWDFLRFKIDGFEKGAWDGEESWTEVTFPISEGVHTLTWSYEKDGSVSNGSDCGWVDFITFPPFGDPNPQLSYDPESFIFTIGNEIISDTITITNEGTGPLIYSINVVDTIGNNVDWLALDLENGGLNAGGSDEIHVDFDATDLEEGNYVAYITITDHMENDYVIPVFMFVDIASGIHSQEIISEFDNIPNPFSNKTTIHFTLNNQAAVALEIYNLKGEKIQTLITNTAYNKGEHFVIWNALNGHGSKVESGVYFYRLNIDKEVVTGKMILKN
ncbi:MAG: T9SS type A sorting domain-containing protein, partial [Bacteroidales bacterium]|nr:T9SS type A sorting domain-containing protein [Bacteroidales bacterium]